MNQLNRDLRARWEQCSTSELEEMLQAELEKKPPEDERILLLLHILEDREVKAPQKLTDREEEALERYMKKRAKRKKARPSFYEWLSIAASVGLVCILVLSVIPQKAEAESFWEMLQRMTSTVIAYFSPQDVFDEAESTYIFTTDNAGLQQVYDAVVEFGVMEPVVPMWLPEGYLLNEIDIYKTPMSNGVYTVFCSIDSEIVYHLETFDGEPALQYYKDDTYYDTWEWEGDTYQIARNNERWIVVWGQERIKCSIAVDCQEETLRRILESIYVMEDE